MDQSPVKDLCATTTLLKGGWHVSPVHTGPWSRAGKCPLLHHAQLRQNMPRKPLFCTRDQQHCSFICLLFSFFFPENVSRLYLLNRELHHLLVTFNILFFFKFWNGLIDWRPCCSDRSAGKQTVLGVWRSCGNQQELFLLILKPRAHTYEDIMSFTTYNSTYVNSFNINSRAQELQHTNALHLCSVLESVLSR